MKIAIAYKNQARYTVLFMIDHTIQMTNELV